MNILIVRSFANIVNLKTYNLQEIGMAKGLIKLGNKCDVVYYNGKNEDRLQTISYGNISFNIYWLKGYSIFRDGIMPSLKNIVSKYDRIIFDSYNALMSLWAIKKIPTKCILYQGPYPSQYTKKYVLKTKIIDKIFYSKIDKSKVRLMAKSALAEEFLKRKGFSNISVVGVGLNTDSLDDTEKNDSKALRLKLSSLDKNIKIILYIGKIEERRNITFLIDVFRRLVQISQDYRLLLIGNGEKEYTEKCWSMLENYDLKEKVMYINSVEQSCLKYVYQVSDAFIFPSEYEIFGMVLLEAMYFGLPVFTTYNGGSSTLIDTNNNGFILQESNATEWADKIESVLNNREKYKSVSKAAHETIVKHYTWEERAKEIEKAIY